MSRYIEMAHRFALSEPAVVAPKGTLVAIPALKPAAKLPPVRMMPVLARKPEANPA